MNNLSHTPCRSEHIVSIKARWLSVLQLWLAGFCTDAHTCGRADARTLAHFHKGKNFLYVLDTLPSFFPPFSRFPHFLLLCHAKSCRCTGSSSVSSAGAECRMRIQVAMRGEKKTPDVDMFKSSEKSYNKGGSALLNSQSPNNVSPLAVIYNAFFLSLPVSLLLSTLKGSFFKYFFFFAGVNCQALPLWLPQRLC